MVYVKKIKKRLMDVHQGLLETHPQGRNVVFCLRVTSMIVVMGHVSPAKVSVTMRFLMICKIYVFHVLEHLASMYSVILLLVHSILRYMRQETLRMPKIKVTIVKSAAAQTTIILGRLIMAAPKIRRPTQ